MSLPLVWGFVYLGEPLGYVGACNDDASNAFPLEDGRPFFHRIEMR